MRLEWIEDLLAIIDSGTLTRAASLRLLTQPAFSRRFRTIEEALGVELLDRQHRPARLTAAVLAQEGRLRELAASLRQVNRELCRSDAALASQVIVASQHAITTSITPLLLRDLLPSNFNFRLRSANREECYALVMTRQADLALCYQTADDRFASDDTLLDEHAFGVERLVPVFARDGVAKVRRECRQNGLPIVIYPTSVFFGRRMEQELVPYLPPGISIVRRAETALTLAALQLAIVGVGIAWVPRSLAVRHLEDGTLADLSDWLPSSNLTVAAMRINQSKGRSAAEVQVWSRLTEIDDLRLLSPVPAERPLRRQRSAVAHGRSVKPVRRPFSEG